MYNGIDEGSQGAAVGESVPQGSFEPIIYTVDVLVGADDGDQGEGVININNLPCAIRRIQHCILGVDNAGSGLKYPQLQDSQYRIEWTVNDQLSYKKGPDVASLHYGNPATGVWNDLPVDVPLKGTDNLTVKITNTSGVTRAAAFTVQVAFICAQLIDRKGR